MQKGTLIVDQRAITRSGVKVSPVGLGCVTFGREIDQETSFKLLDHALDKGINLLDTAESYGGGQARDCLLYTSPSPRDATLSRMPSSA